MWFVYAVVEKGRTTLIDREKCIHFLSIVLSIESKVPITISLISSFHSPNRDIRAYGWTMVEIDLQCSFVILGLSYVVFLLLV